MTSAYSELQAQSESRPARARRPGAAALGSHPVVEDIPVVAWGTFSEFVTSRLTMS